MTCILGNNGMYGKEQFVLLGAGWGAASERVISELGLGRIKECYRRGGGVKVWAAQAQGTVWIKAQKHEHAWHILERVSSSRCEHRALGWGLGGWREAAWLWRSCKAFWQQWGAFRGFSARLRLLGLRWICKDQIWPECRVHGLWEVKGRQVS